MTGIVVDFQNVVYNPLVGVMSADLGLTFGQVGWIINALPVASAFALGLSTRYADIVGHRRVLIPLVFLGIVGSVVSATADGFLMMVIGRALVGVAISAPMAWGLLKSNGSDRDVETGALVNGTAISIATPIGLILGGALLSLGLSWSISFWIIGAGYAVLLVMAILAPETPPRSRSEVSLDWFGAIGLTGWLVCLLIAVSEGPTRGWLSAPIIVLYIATVVIFSVWLLQQRRSIAPLMDFRDMDVPQVVTGYVAFVTVFMLAYGLYILIPSFALTAPAAGYGFGMDQLEAGLILLPILPSTIVAIFVTRFMLRCWGPRTSLVVGGLICTVAFVGYALFTASAWQLYLCTAVYGLGVVICFNVGMSLVAASARSDNMSITLGVQFSIALPASAIAVAVVLAILDPGTSGEVPSVSAFTTSYVLLAAVSLIGFVLVPILIAPTTIRHWEHQPQIPRT
ncbi:MFS transporter [Rhodococcus fascians]|nr:MFS transporter [Rhodococcus fascians]MBY3999467.1 MFS transporter [Rhodococcus fascians]MBY4005000.1 MFS transporter [Rhodococcus fascians]MBY4010127.1 MFS transporter [Rhodococcus fascians]MBY4020207.1 MFS transporter [Rhodococcus fascians]